MLTKVIVAQGKRIAIEDFKPVRGADCQASADESTQGISAQKSTGGVSHWVNFWIVSNLMHLITGILEHGSPENMPAFYIIFKMVALVYLPLAESDLSGKFLECCVTPFFKPLVPEIDSAFNDVMNELTTKSSKLFDMAKTKASAKRGALPRKPSPPAPSSS
ncbi:hypothetical protein DI09_7p90 [Mitosporidium daphniae]|uniref:Uncharacterized protein n=1 Tax=Mitosporidium daphniae TaxID=1485682 RepID=A0A098VMN4_9MICR|nr:uncharacterized protein DI09_7p90 [Mitosporidium daphniae]KGG50230.1 hypothetical protein DI09_7p90 [Mitosporidium daphniae]|eukprot:XP_013236713.1 uncharacterized protein DI09_7p90 [Mitosporidium daphniae]